MDAEEAKTHIEWKISGTKLENGWVVSGIFVYSEKVRVQLMPPIAEVRKTFEAPSFEEALQKAVKFSEIYTEGEYMRRLYG